MRREYALYRIQRKVGKVLVVNLVELVSINRSQKVGKLYGHDATGCQQSLDATHEVIDIRHLREHVVAQYQVGAMTRCREPARGFAAKELDDRRDSFLLGHLRDIRSRLDTQNRNPSLYEELQQITIIAGELDHFAGRSQPKLRDHLVHVPSAMVQPRIGE